MEIKLDSGKKLKVKNIGLDDRDMLLDSVKYQYNQDGSPKGVEMMHSTMTKWMRTCLHDSSDKTLLSFSLEDKSNIFAKLQAMFFMGEEKASK